MFNRNNGSFVSLTHPSWCCSNFSAAVWTHTHQSPVCARKSPEQVMLCLCACAQGTWFKFRSVPGVYLFSFSNTTSIYKLTFPNLKAVEKIPKAHCSHFADNFSLYRKFDMSSEKEFRQHESKANTPIREKVLLFLHLTGPLLPQSSSNKSGWITLILEQDIGQYRGIFLN